MILPSKHLREDRALLTIGAEHLQLLSEPKTVSRLWSDMKRRREAAGPLSYDWFILGLDLLFAMGLVAFERGRVQKTRSVA
ncbi:ABC-three component system middle component 6 [Chondromyces apiculatus]|uniref:Uncharacterized protein n=1 Tax=Chondromyces apiculatus DSM 436 TaxID=1192034 RepID=A0A017T4W1_9BACT|nr:ABC-three component system middle component 6 [Chondromyces apiculatus]EYF04274.1 Hypothetical protein CAP_4751 [Chondromyces apiculatus DSM 436]